MTTRKPPKDDIPNDDIWNPSMTIRNLPKEVNLDGPLPSARVSSATDTTVLNVAVLRLDSSVHIPSYAHPGDAGIDLSARTDVVLPAAGGRSLVPTGLAVALPSGYAGFVLPRSGLALKHGVTCLNSPGLIDSGYRGELKVLLVNTDPETSFTVKRGERIAQLVIQSVECARLIEVASLEPSERGDKGFGSTGL